IIEEVRKITFFKSKQNPKIVWSVSEVVDLYVDAYNKSKLKRAENSILKSQGLTIDSWLNRQNSFTPDFVTGIKKELSEFTLETIETIICGIDATGPHIWAFLNNEFYRPSTNPIRCLDITGF